MRRLVVVGIAPWGTKTIVSSSNVQLPNHYMRLGVDPTASAVDIKAAYRKKALECHPDVVESSEKARAEAEFRRISESFRLLADENRRKDYDIKAGLSPQPEVVKPKPAPRKRPDPFQPMHKRPLRNRTWKQGMLRGEAEEVFREAFDGMSVDEVVFRARAENKWNRGAEPAAPRPPRSTFAMLHRAAPPSSHMHFIPFVNQVVPAGVTHDEVKAVASVGKLGVDVDPLDVQLEPRRASWPLREDYAEYAKKRPYREKERNYPHNMGMLWSYHRPY